MNDAKVTFRVAPVATVAGLPAGTLAANGELRVVTAATADFGLWICVGAGVWSKVGNILASDGTSGVIAAGATANVGANLIPAGSLVLGVTIRVVTLPPGPVTLQIGDGVDADRWGTGIAVAAGTVTSIADFTIASPVYYAAAANVVITAVGGNFTGGGVILARVHYQTLGNP